MAIVLYIHSFLKFDDDGKSCFKTNRLVAVNCAARVCLKCKTAKCDSAKMTTSKMRNFYDFREMISSTNWI